MTAAQRTGTGLFLFLLGSFSSATAQIPDRGPLVLDLPASTRALALGNAFHLASRDASVVFYHPGRLMRAQGFGGSLQRFGGKGTLVGFSAGTEWFGGGVAMGFRQLSYEEPSDAEMLPSIFASGRPSARHGGDEAYLRDEGAFGISETVLSVGYGRTLMGLQAGMVGKLVEKRKGSRKAGTAAVDLGLATSAGPLTMALSVLNLGPAMKVGGQEVDLPTRVSLGVSSDSKPVGPLDISVSGALDHRIDGDVVPSLGLEVGYWPVNGRTFVGRIGYRHRSAEYQAIPVTFGGAFYGDNIGLEYAFLGFDSGNPSHRFGIGWR